MSHHFDSMLTSQAREKVLRLKPIQTGIPPASPSPRKTPTVVKQALTQEVRRVPVLGGDDSLRPRRGSAPPVLARSTLAEIKENLVKASIEDERLPHAIDPVAKQQSSVPTEISPAQPTPLASADMSRDASTVETWRSQPTIVSGPSTATNQSVHRPAAGSRTASMQTNPSVDGDLDQVSSAITEVHEERKSPSFDVPQFRRPRGNSIMHRIPFNQFAGNNMGNQRPIRPHVMQQSIVPNHQPLSPRMGYASMYAIGPPGEMGMPQMPMGRVQYASPVFHQQMGYGPQLPYRPGSRAGHYLQSPRPHPQSPRPHPQSPARHPQSPSLPVQSMTYHAQCPRFENRRPSPLNPGFQQRMENFPPGLTSVTVPFQGQPVNMQHYIASMPPMSEQQFFISAPGALAPHPSSLPAGPEFSVQMDAIESAVAVMPSDSGARKHPQKSFTDDARVLESMAEEELPLHQQLAARRSSQSSSQNEGFGRARRLSRGSFSQNQPKLLPHVPEAALAQGSIPPPPLPSTYFGYATRDPADGSFNHFEPAHPAYKTSRGKQQVLDALRATDEANRGQQTAVPMQQLPVVHEQTAMVHGRSHPQDQMQSRQLSVQSAQVAESVKANSQQKTEPLHSSGQQNRSRLAFERETDPCKLYVSGPSVTEQLLQRLFEPLGPIVEISNVRSKMHRYIDRSGENVNRPRSDGFRFAFVT